MPVTMAIADIIQREVNGWERLTTSVRRKEMKKIELLDGLNEEVIGAGMDEGNVK
jgi:hypothetical protein